MPLKNLISGIKALFHKEHRDQELNEELVGFQLASPKRRSVAASPLTKPSAPHASKWPASKL